MASTAIDSRIIGGLFSSDEMREIFSDTRRLQSYLDVEAALARVEARLGLIPPAAADEITAKARASLIDQATLARHIEHAGSVILPLVEQLRAQCAGDLGQWCHWGATTQDIMDTGVVLQMRDALAIVGRELDGISSSLVSIAREHRDTLMAGRTKLQHAAPITLGFKATAMLDAVERDRSRLRELRPRVLVGQFGGAVGTLAALGEKGLRVRDALMEELGLGIPDITWHTHRDRFAETGCFLALVTGTLGKITTDVKLLMQTEVGEVAEPSGEGRGSSSTMPQKQNPVSCNYILACASHVRHQAHALLEAMAQDHERGTGPWEVEWVAVPEIFLLAGGALSQTRSLLEGLQVFPSQMRKNLDMTNGLIVSEAVMMGLAPFLGRSRAHELVGSLCRNAVASKRPLVDVLAENDQVAQHLDRDALERVCDPSQYLGSFAEMIDKVLERAR